MSVGFRVLDDDPRRPHLDFYRGNPLPFYEAAAASFARAF